MDIKRRLTTELASIVKIAVKENRAEHVDVLPSDILNSVCNVIEAIFIHGLKETKSSKTHTSFRSKPAKPSYPEPNFWPFLQKFTHRNIRAQIANLNQIKTDIGRGRVWIRIALNDSVLENYLSAILKEDELIRHYYRQDAYLRDSEQCDLMLNYVRALSKVTFKAPLNSNILNEWTPSPLKLAGLLNEKLKPTHISGTMLDMEDLMENDENSDVPVAMSALEYDGYDEPSLSDISDVRSESQFSVQSRPVAAYGDRRLFSPDGGSFSGSDFLQEGINNIGGNRRPNELTNINESTLDEEQEKKLDAVLTSIGGADEEDDGKNPFMDSGVATSPPISASVPVVHRQQNVKKTATVGTETTSLLAEQNIESRIMEQGNEKPETLETNPFGTELPPETQNEGLYASAEPVPVVNDMFSCTQQLEMSFSPGNSLAAHGWSSPNYECTTGISSPSTASMNSSERILSSSVGNSSGRGFAALFSAVLDTANVPKCRSEGGSAGTSLVVSHLLADTVKSTENVDISKSEVLDGVNQNRVPQMESRLTTATIVIKDGYKNPEVEVAVLEQRELKLTKSSSSSSLDNFVLVEESQESVDEAAAQKTFRLSLLTKIAEEIGLDVQGFKCHSCQRTIGLPLFGTYRFCSYDGHYYCVECHLNDEKLIPARILYNWDFKPRSVSRASKAFLDLIADQPLIDIQKTNPGLPDVIKAVKETKTLRLQLSYVAVYLLTCKESVADDLRKRVWPKEYLYNNVDLYSISDFTDIRNGQMQKHLKSIIQYAIKHVLQQCRLCAQKGFICELCNDRKIIYAFQLDLTHRCSKCHAVYHLKCWKSQKQSTCPKCVRRELYMKQAERSSFSLDNVLPLGV